MEDGERVQIQQSAMCSACDTNWRDNANCVGINPDIFDETKPDYDEVAAKKACGGCAVRECCLEFALSVPDKTPANEIWGGLTGTEREELTRTS